MSRRLLLVTASRALADDAAAEAEARAILTEAIAGMHDGAIVVSGGARGGDTWAAEIARAHGVKLVEFKLDGGRYENGVRVGAWGDPATHDPATFPLLRNDVMIAAAVKAVAAGWIVEVLALLADPRIGTSRGTDFTARHAAIARLAVQRITVPRPPAYVAPASVWFDVESGGFSPTKNALLEIGAVHATDGHRRLVSSFEIKLAPAPGLTIEPRAAEINGFTWADWADALPERDALKRFLAWLPAGPLVFGNQNIAFDINFLNAACARNELTAPAWYAHGETICTKQGITRVLKKTGKLPGASLGPAADHFGIPNSGAHRALADAERARLVYLKLIEQEPVGPTLFDGDLAAPTR